MSEENMKSIFEVSRQEVEESPERVQPITENEEPTDSYGLNRYFASRRIAQQNEGERGDEELLRIYRDPENLLKQREEQEAKNKQFGEEVSQILDQPVKESQEVDTEGKEKKEQPDDFSLIRIAAGGIADGAEGVVNFGIDVINFVDNELGIDGLDDNFKVEMVDKMIPRSTHGGENLLRGIVSFLVPFTGITKATKGVSLGFKYGGLAKSAMIGAASDIMAFDPDEDNLSGMVQKVDWMRNPVTEYLATGDSRLEKRINNAIEGLGFAGLGGAFVKALKFYRARRAFKDGIDKKAMAEKLQNTTKEVATEIKDKVKVNYEKILEKLKSNKSVDDIQEALDLQKQAEAMGVKLPNKNPLAPIAKPDDAMKFIKSLSEGDVKSSAAIMSMLDDEAIEQAKRGKFSVEGIMARADEEGMTLKELLNLPEGTALNVEQLAAAWNIFDTTYKNLIKVSKQIEAGKATYADGLDALDIMRMVNVKVQAAGSETGRALGFLSKDVIGSGRKQTLQTIKDITEFHGEQNLKKLFNNLATMTPEQAIETARKGRFKKIFDAALEVRVNGLLSSPRTLMTNILSNSAVTGWAPVETAWARTISKLRGSDAFEGEASAQIAGMVEGFSDGIRLAKKAFKTGQFSDSGKMAAFRQRAISAEAFEAKGNLGRAVDVLGETISIPGRMLIATDEFFKAVNYRMEFNKLWARRYKELRKLDLDDKRIATEYRKFQKNNNIKMQSEEFARYNTFTNDLPEGTWSANMEATLRTTPFGRLMFPFLRTNLNIVRFGLERAPGLGMLMPEVMEAWKRGGASRDMVIAKQSLGAGIVGLGAALGYKGVITGSGPGHPDAARMWKNAGNQPYSVRVGGKSFAFNRLDPLGSILALGADLGQLASYAQNQEGQYAEYAQAAALAVGHAYTPEFLIEQVGDLVDIIARDDLSGMERFVVNTPATFIPFSGALRDIRKDVDPFMRITTDKNKVGIYGAFEGAINKMKNTIPGWSSTLPMRINRLGDPVMYPTGYTPEIISPIATAQKKPGVVYEEIVKLGMASPIARTKPVKGQTRLAIDRLDPYLIDPVVGKFALPLELQSKYAKLAAGIDLPNNIPTLKEALEKEIKDGYPTIPLVEKTDNAKRIIIRGIFKTYEDLGKAEMMKQPEVKEYIDSLKKEVGKLNTIGPQSGEPTL